MSTTNRVTALRYAMIGTGLIFIVGLPILLFTPLWPSGWSWGTGHSHYPMMIAGVYGTLGVSLVVASRDPLANRSLIWFTVWSSVVHAVVMAVQAFMDGTERGHLVGDVPALFLVAGVLGVLAAGAARPRAVADSGARRVA
jgi:hypothetical protein